MPLPSPSRATASTSEEPIADPGPAGGNPGYGLDEALDAFPAVGLLDSGRGVVAFSGGPDSTALLVALVRRRRRLGGPPLLAAHLDHAADPGSRLRARRAAALARRLGIPFVVHRLPSGTLAEATGEGPEATARRHRYAFLAAVAGASGAAWVATGHHLDDQAETVLLRLAFGSGFAGLAGVRPDGELPGTRLTAGKLKVGTPPGGDLPGETPSSRKAPLEPRLLRPLLAVRRETLAAAVDAAAILGGLAPTADPANRDLALPRNRLRNRILPALEAAARRRGEPPLAPRLARLAERARGAAAAVDGLLAAHLRLRPETLPSLDLDRLGDLPPSLLPAALALLHRAGGLPYPPGHEARRELRRQLAAGSEPGCDCGDGWRWEGRDGRLVLVRPHRRSPAPAFSYILEVPGEVEIREIGQRLRLRPAPVASWMFRGAPHRAGMDLPLSPGDLVTVRNRRPGDRVHPLGAAGRRRLKDVLVDRRIPRQQRDRLPLLCLGGRIAWVPGVTVEDAFRLPRRPAGSAGAPPAEPRVWVADLRPLESTESTEP